jgi:hypothetical protein
MPIVTWLLQCCYSIVKGRVQQSLRRQARLLSRCCHIVVRLLLHRFYTALTLLLHSYHQQGGSVGGVGG